MLIQIGYNKNRVSLKQIQIKWGNWKGNFLNITNCFILFLLFQFSDVSPFAPTLPQPMVFFPYYDIENLKILGFVFGNLGFLV
jgi:hypothetical protein